MYETRLFQIMTTDFEVDDKKRVCAYKQLASTVKSHGIGVIRSKSNRYKYGWNGKSIRIDEPANSTSMRVIYDLAHEYSHFLCASPARRYHLDFGLGPGFSTEGVDVQELSSPEIIQDEENCVCLLAAIITNYLGLPTLNECINVNFIYREGFGDRAFRWSDWVAPGEVEHSFANLLTWGVIDSDCNPTFKMREIVEDPKPFTTRPIGA